MHFEYSYMMEDGLSFLAALISGFPAAVLNIGTYVLTALALYTLAQRRGIRHGWLAWIPVISGWVLGSLSDQYRYVVKGEFRSKRKSLLVLNIFMSCLGTALLVLGIAAGVTLAMGRPSASTGLLAALVCMGLATGVIAIIRLVIRFIALHDIYRSMDPENSSLFLVLSILFPVTEPFFLFFNRNKELGMPPRRNTSPAQEPWEQENKDYL